MNKVVKKKKKSGETWKYIKKCIPYFMIKKKEVIILLTSSVLLALSSSFFPALSGKVLEHITQGNLDRALLIALIATVFYLLSDYMRI